MPVITNISDRADVVLVEEEGDVLKAYRCPAGVLTIGTGLTAASGVVTPKAGMVITAGESTRLRRLALARNYEPAVVKALPTDKQNVFDGAVLWHWNTGAIARASWVKLFRANSLQQARLSFLSWNRAGPKVVAGLTRRRNREWNIIEFANYGMTVNRPAPPALSEFSDHVHDFRTLGYDTSKGPMTTVVAFQRDHDLVQDGKIGPATRATLQRALAAKTANKGAAAGGVTGGMAGGGGELAVNAPGDAPATPVDALHLETLLWIGAGAALCALLVWGIALAWRYRGPLFAWLPEPVKDWFEQHGVVLGRRVRT